MKLRFKLRTLLILTAIVALYAGYLGNRLYLVRSEKRAVEALATEWHLDLDNRYNNLPEPESGLRKMLDWPLRGYYGDEELKRHFQLGLYSNANDTKTTMRQLAKLDFVDTVIIDRNHSSNKYLQPIIEPDDFQFLRGMKRLQGLTIRTDVGEGLIHLKGLPLTELVLSSKRPYSDSDYELLGGLSNLEVLQLSTDQVDYQDLVALSQLKELKRLAISADEIHSKPDIEFPNLKVLSLRCSKQLCDLLFLANSSKLTRVFLNGEITESHILQLAKAPTLQGIDLVSTNVDDSFLQSLLSMNVKEIQFGESQITAEVFDALRDAGIAVGHYGLKDYSPSHNFLRVGDYYYQIDRSRSTLTATVVPDEAFVRWSFDVNNETWYAPAGQFVSLESPEFKLNKGLDELIGTKVSEVVDPEWGNLYTGIHQLPVGHKLRFISRDKNRFHIVCDFQTESFHGEDALLDTEIDFTEVVVRTEKRCSIVEAITAVAKHFDLSHFEAPVRIEKAWKPMIKFALKKEYCKPRFKRENHRENQ